MSKELVFPVLSAMIFDKYHRSVNVSNADHRLRVAHCLTRHQAWARDRQGGQARRHAGA